MMTREQFDAEAGVVLVITALGIMTFAMLVGLVIDSGLLEYRKLTLHTAAMSSSLRMSQLYYDGGVDAAAAEGAARETARLNLVYSGVPAADAAVAAANMTLGADAVTGKVIANVSTAERMYFAHVMKGDPFRAVGADAAATYVRRDVKKQHYRHLYIVFSRFAAMTGPFQATADVEVPPPQSTAVDGSKAAVGTEAVVNLLDKLDGQLVTLVGYGENTATLTNELPINDDPSPIAPEMSNRDYAKQQAAEYLQLDYGAELSPALLSVKHKLQQLTADEREEALVLVISDGIVVKPMSLLFPIGACPLDSGKSIDLANDIRELGVTVSTIGLYATGVELTGGSNPFMYLVVQVLDELALYGQPFMEALASASDFGVRCKLQGGPLIYPNDLRIGRYFKPRTKRDLSVFLEEATSRREFLSKLPRRIDTM